MGDVGTDPVLNNTADRVDAVLLASLDRSAEAYEIGLNILQNMSDYAGSTVIPSIDVAFNLPVVDTTFNLPEPPSAPNITMAVGSLPSTPVMPSIRTPTVTAVPEFTETAPVITLPAAPSPLDIGDIPVAPDIDTDITLPTEPTLVLPDLPTLEELTIPEAPTITIPSFTTELPTSDDLIPPTISFDWTEDDYDNSALYDAIQAHLIDSIANGGTGLNPVVEQAIYDRGRTREEINSLKTKNEIIETYASRGFALPPGIEFMKLQEVTQEAQNALSTLSRDILIKQAELEQENIKHAITSSIQLESAMINLFNSAQQRSFDAAKFIQTTIMEVYNMILTKFNAQVDLYRAAAIAYETTLKGENAKLDEYRIKIEAQRAVGEVNRLALEAYATEVDTLKTQADIYKTVMEGVKARLEAEGLKIEVFRGEIDGYKAQLESKQTELQTYVTQVNAEVSKTEVYDSQARAFTARVQGYAASVDAQKTITDADIASAKATMDYYISRLRAFEVQASAQADAARIQAGVFEAETSAYRSKVASAQVEGELTLSQARINLETVKSSAEIGLANAKAQADLAVAKIEATLTAFSGASQAASQLMHASTNMVNVQASISGNSNNNVTHYYPHQERV